MMIVVIMMTVVMMMMIVVTTMIVLMMMIVVIMMVDLQSKSMVISMVIDISMNIYGYRYSSVLYIPSSASNLLCRSSSSAISWIFLR